MSNQADTRADSSLSTATRVAIMVAVAALIVAIYYYTSPTNFLGKDGGLFECGSPMSPNTSNLGKGQCAIVEGAAAHKAYLWAALAVATAILGFVLFNAGGTQSRTGAAHRRSDDEFRNQESRRAASRRLDVGDDAPRERRAARLGDEDFAPVNRRSGSFRADDRERDEDRDERDRYDDTSRPSQIED